MSKPVQSKPVPWDEVTDKDETEEVNPVTDEPTYKFITLLGDELETVIESNEDEIDDGNLATSGGITCPDPQRALSKHRDLDQPKITSSCIEKLPCPINNSLIVCGAGITIRWTDNDSTSDQSKEISLGPLAY